MVQPVEKETYWRVIGYIVMRKRVFERYSPKRPLYTSVGAYCVILHVNSNFGAIRKKKETKHKWLKKHAEHEWLPQSNERRKRRAEKAESSTAKSENES